MTNFLQGLNRKYFFEKYAPKVGNWVHKLRGKNGSSTAPLTFSDHDKQLIRQGLEKLFKDLNKRVQ